MRPRNCVRSLATCSPPNGKCSATFSISASRLPATSASPAGTSWPSRRRSASTIWSGLCGCRHSRLPVYGDSLDDVDRHDSHQGCVHGAIRSDAGSLGRRAYARSVVRPGVDGRHRPSRAHALNSGFISASSSTSSAERKVSSRSRMSLRRSLAISRTSTTRPKPACSRWSTRAFGKRTRGWSSMNSQAVGPHSSSAEDEVDTARRLGLPACRSHPDEGRMRGSPVRLDLRSTRFRPRRIIRVRLHAPDREVSPA